MEYNREIQITRARDRQHYRRLDGIKSEQYQRGTVEYQWNRSQRKCDFAESQHARTLPLFRTVWFEWSAEIYLLHVRGAFERKLSPPTEVVSFIKSMRQHKQDANFASSLRSYYSLRLVHPEHHGTPWDNWKNYVAQENRVRVDLGLESKERYARRFYAPVFA